MEERLTLAEFEDLEDFDNYRQWLSDDIVFRFLESNSRVSSESDIWDYINGEKKSGSIFMAVIFKPNQVHIGNLKIYNFQFEEGLKSAEYSRLIGDKAYWGMGLGYELGRLALDYCFGSLGLDVVVAGCVSSNGAAIKSNLKLGFKEINRINKYVKAKDKVEEVVRFSLHKSDFLSV